MLCAASLSADDQKAMRSTNDIKRAWKIPPVAAPAADSSSDDSSDDNDSSSSDDDEPAKPAFALPRDDEDDEDDEDQDEYPDPDDVEVVRGRLLDDIASLEEEINAAIAADDDNKVEELQAELEGPVQDLDRLEHGDSEDRAAIVSSWGL